MAAIAGKLGAVYVKTTDASTTFTNEATTEIVADTRFRITSTSKRFWDKSAGVTVKVNGVTVTTGFTIEYAGGEIVFSPALAANDTVTVSGKYWTMTQKLLCSSWSIDASLDNSDITTFASSGWKENLPTLNSFSVSLENYWSDGDFTPQFGSEVALQLFVDSGTNKYRYECYAAINSESIETPVDDVVNDTIELTGVGNLYYRSA